MADKLSALNNLLGKTSTEEEVKHAWATCLGVDYDTADDHDLYTPQILFEFKYDKKFGNKNQLATVLAQLLYYLHRLKYGESGKGIPAEFCLADRNQAVVGKVAEWRDLYAARKVLLTGI